MTILIHLSSYKIYMLVLLHLIFYCFTFSLYNSRRSISLISKSINVFVRILVLRYGNAEILSTAYSVKDLVIKAVHILGLEQNRTTIF